MNEAAPDANDPRPGSASGDGGDNGVPDEDIFFIDFLDLIEYRG